MDATMGQRASSDNDDTNNNDLPPHLVPRGPQIMPPPPTPSRPQSSNSSTSSSRKRKRDDVHHSSAASSSSLASSDFSTSVKKRVKALNNGLGCFYCGMLESDICHVVPKKPDNVYDEYKEPGMFNFRLGGEENAVPLCPSCHRVFDNAANPGLFFVPVDLEYFKQFELRDFARRTDALRSRRSSNTTHPVAPQRQCPTAQNYLTHLQQQGRVGDDACGGLYWQYTLRKFYPSGLGPGATPFKIPGKGPKQEPVPWHGAPMAALFRAFQALGRLRSALPNDLKRDMRELQDLYDRDLAPEDELPSDATTSEGQQQQIASDDPRQRAQGTSALLSTHTGEETSRDISEPPIQHTGPSPNRQAAARDSAIDVSSDYKANTEVSTKEQRAQGANIFKPEDGRCSTMAHAAKENPEADQDASRTCQGERWTWGPDSSSEQKAYYMSQLLAL